MDSQDLAAFKTLQQWSKAAPAVWLVTVLKTYGSSPRPPGAMLVLRQDGQMVGSVSGGCIEDDLVDKAINGALSTQQAQRLLYGATADEVSRFNLPCGGTLELLIEPVLSTAWIDQVLTAIQQHQLIQRSLNLKTMAVICRPASSTAAQINLTEALFSQVHGPRWRLLIIGAAQTSVYLAEMAKALDYQVFVCDPRQGMLNDWPVAEVTLLSSMPDDAVLQLEPDAHTAIVALTHDPKLDDMALLEALKSAAFYVGALGSKKNNANRRQRLALFDLSATEIERLYGPVGLSIGSRTPPEIAIAILAQLIELRRKGAQTAPQAKVHENLLDDM